MRFKFMFKNAVESLKQNKGSALLLILLLVASVVAVYYVLGIGYTWVMNSVNVVNGMKTFSITFTEGGKPDSLALLEKIKEVTEVENYCVTSKTLIFRYYDLAKNKNSDRIKIAAFYSDKYSAKIDTGTELLQKDGDIFFDFNFYGLKAGDTVFLEKNELTVSGTGILNFPLKLSLSDITAYVPLNSIDKYISETDSILILLPSVPDKETINAVLSVIEGVPSVEQVIPPNLSPDKKIDRLQVYMAIAIMLLSFINIYAGLSFFLKVRQREYLICGLCGASPRYIFLDITCFTILLTLIPYIIGTALYYIAPLFSYGKGVDIVINPFISFVTLIIFIAGSLTVIIPLIRNQKSNLTFS
ncbi:MAG TPA: FtsX-like permease family protein [Clostridia bacterium]|nr:FtsX-like permease family protein [Clostridia bacterium]